MRRLSRSDETGVAMIELALVLTFLAVLIFGIIDFGYTLSDYQNVRQGVREAVREAASNPSQFTTTSQFNDFIVARSGVSASQLTVSWKPSGSITGGSNFEVCVDYATKSITGFAAAWLPKTLHSDVVMRMEPPQTTGFPAPPGPLAPC